MNFIRLSILALLISCLPAWAQQITLTATVTNRAVTSNSFTANSSVRVFTNVTAALTVATNLTSINASKTNLFNQIAAFPFTGLTLSDIDTNSFRLRAAFGAALSGSITGAWGYVTLATQSGQSTFTMLYPVANVVGETNRTNQSSDIVSALNTFATNFISTNAVPLSNYLSKGAQPVQKVSGPVALQGRTSVDSNFFATNGFTSALTNINPVTSNLVNYGNAIRSEGSGGNSLQLGSNAQARGLNNIAVGNGALASNDNAIAFGTGASATNQGANVFGLSAASHGIFASVFGNTAVASNYGSAFGSTAKATGEGSGAFGRGAEATALDALSLGGSSGDGTLATAPYAIAVANKGGGANKNYALALGPGASAIHSNSAAIGPPDHLENFVTTTATNQIRLGTANHHVSIPGFLRTEGGASNFLTVAGSTNIIRGDLSAPWFALSTLANGNNISVPFGTNLLIRFTGTLTSTGTICGAIAGATSGGRDGQVQLLWNDTGQPVVLAQNTVDPIPANRFSLQGGADVFMPADTFAWIAYATSVARWKVTGLYPNTNLVASATNAIATVWSNSIAVITGTATNLNFIESSAIQYRITNNSGRVDLQVLSTASGTNQLIQTNGVNLGAAGTVNWTTGVTGYLAGVVANLGASAVGGAGEANVNGEVSVTNATRFGWVYDKAGVTNRLRSFAGRNGLVGTNEGTNISIAIDPAVVASQGNLTTASNSLITEIGNGSNSLRSTMINALTNKVENLNGVATNLTTYSGSPAFTVVPQTGIGSNSFQVLNTNLVPVVFVMSNSTLVTSNLNAKGYLTNDVLTASRWVTTDANKAFASSAYADADMANLQGGTNGLDAAVKQRQFGSTVLTNIVGLADTSFTNVLKGGTNISVRTAGGTNFIDTTGHLNNWSQIPTGAMANVVAADFLTNWANSISNLTQTKQQGNAVLSNLVGTAARNVTNFVSLSTTNATSKPLTNSYTAGVLTLFGLEAGANITLGQNASNITITGSAGGSGFANLEAMTNGVRVGLQTNLNFLTNANVKVFATNNASGNRVDLQFDVQGNLADWALYSTNVWNPRQGGNAVLSNLVGTVARNVTNVVSLSTTNAMSKPLTNSYASGILELFGLEAGANITLTPNASNIVIASTGGGSGMAALEVMTNDVATAGGIRAGLATNVVFKHPPWAIFTTNNSGSNSVEITIQPYRPFAILDKTNIFYHDMDWDAVVDEEFEGNIQGTVSSAFQPGKHPWSQPTTAGTLPLLAAPIVETNAVSYISMVSTQSASGRIWTLGYGSGSFSEHFILLTNAETFWSARVRMSATNSSGNVDTLRVGFYSTAAGAGEASNGQYVMINTNVNTNTFVCVNARASTRTFGYPTSAAATWTAMKWFYVGAWLDRTGTNSVFFAGTAMTNLTSIWTNVANHPNTVMVSPTYQGNRIASASGDDFRTNYIDSYEVYVKHKY